ncbi:MAG TPA: hypothetical protein VER03_09065 [Bryobacteraceae bacterium]|nr:hypothetical protein [Bryobacteraceae bacterium]
MTIHQLLQEVLQRGHLNEDEAKCLEHLSANSSPDNRAAERHIRVLEGLLKMREKAVGMLVKRLNAKLQEDYNYPSGCEDRLVISTGGRAAMKARTNYLVRVVTVKVPAKPLFWAAHLQHSDKVVLVSNIPLFFCNPERTERLRVLSVNTTVEQKLHPVVKDYSPSFHYVSMGDFRFCVALTRYFLARQKDLEVRLVPKDRNLDDMENPFDTVNVEKEKNLIAIGNSRVSCLVADRMKKIDPNFYLKDGEPNRIYNKNPLEGSKEEPYYEDNPQANGHYYVLLIRSVRDSRVDTVIAVQNGPALERIVPLLTGDLEFAQEIKRRWPEGGLPSSFELLFRVAVAENEMARRASSVTLVASRPVQPASGIREA